MYVCCGLGWHYVGCEMWVGLAERGEQNLTLHTPLPTNIARKAFVVTVLINTPRLSNYHHV